ncbi:helix-turn-helix transcriptional regulator [Endozoicomonas sp. GU-1]|uniref:helix-turn-helix transcriptional regulator n=1 Tax=Endozoicomonas sp. GU-1 TaxID=3009078 RepID=UPI0022B54765|nr:hypothetical protein [Endozoicomonas sp. GU-1]WBA86493.1 hypothetical protein O3276_00080 [Endozoicomonas sp. GU-1]
MNKADLSELLSSLLQKLTESDGVDIRHDQLYSRKELMNLLGISRFTLDRVLDSGEFPKPIKVAGQDRWPSSVINRHIRQNNAQLKEDQELMSQARKALEAN